MSQKHFKGKEAIRHVAEKQAEGILFSQEIHGLEVPGHIEAFCDTAKESAALIAIVLPLLGGLDISQGKIFSFLGLLMMVFSLFRFGRSAFISWARLERLHRLLEQERWEIEHNRPQEREELRVLYGAKGFEGELLENVVDVLMSDDDRLLKVMIEEEMKLSLSHIDHPIQQGLFSLLGTFFTASLSFGGIFLLGFWGGITGAFTALLIASFVSAKEYSNRKIDALVWSASLFILTLMTTLFLSDIWIRA